MKIYERKMAERKCCIPRCDCICLLILLAELVLVKSREIFLPQHHLSWSPREANTSFHGDVPSALTSPEPGIVGIRAYRRFHANDSLIGQPVPCTHEEKLCLRYNALYAARFRKCVNFDLFNLVDRDVLLKGSGHLIQAASVQSDRCPGFRMAYDGRCYSQNVVYDYICGCNELPELHFFGGRQCRCGSRTPIHVEQPQEEGRCRIPDLRFPKDRRFEGQYSFYTEEELECCSRGKVWVPQGRGCFSLLERGPCAEKHVVALDKAAGGRVEATCVHERGGCPPGHVRMSFDGQCHNEDDVNIIASSGLHRDAFGLVTGSTSSLHAIKTFIYEGLCSLHEITGCFIPPTSPGPSRPGIESQFVPPSCVRDDNGNCNLYEVINEPPLPEI